jgi:UDP-GlcNAc:undecaprenyl-phosphate/decaprenyl-phosphate GlcNAc-1-phosphate transferase
MAYLSPYILYVISLVLSITFSIYSIPRIIYVAKRKRLFDLPDNERKMHEFIVPNLGGVGIFLAFITAGSLVVNPAEFYKWNYIVCAALILFITGLTDDLINISPSKKFAAQFVAAVVMALFADIRVTSLYGILGVHDLPYWLSVSFTIVGCVFVTNAFNLIDGIDGLAGSIGVLCTLSLGILFALQNQVSAACISFCMVGAIVGFLRYNISPAAIFMGDTGALVIGFIISLLCILFVNTYDPHNLISPVVHSSNGALIVVLCIMFIPVFDSFRVFATRAMKGRSPFSADRNHLHHFLLDLGFSHTRTVLIIVMSNLLIIALGLYVQDHNTNIALAYILIVAFILFGVLYVARRNRMMHDERYLKNSKETLHPKKPTDNQ